MQAFLPYESFVESAACLDTQRLGKQIVEAHAIYHTISSSTENGYSRHPAVLMWTGRTQWLLFYGLCMYMEWIARFKRGQRGGKPDHKSGDYMVATYAKCTKPVAEYSQPWWLGCEDFHSSHRAVLLGKDPYRYSAFGWTEIPARQIDGKWPYWWPTEHSIGVKLRRPSLSVTFDTTISAEEVRARIDKLEKHMLDLVSKYV